MPQFEEEKTPRTGFSVLSSRVATQRKNGKTTSVANPILNYAIGKGVRALAVEQKPPFDINAVRNSYLVDSHIRQAIDKYVELMTKEGYYLKGNKEAIKYVERRLLMMSLMSEPSEPWSTVFHRLIKDFVLYNNAFLVIARCSRESSLASLSVKSLEGRRPIGAYFNLPVHQIFPELDENGKVVSWVQKTRNDKKSFLAKDVIHFSVNKEAGELFAIPPLANVIEDIRALRQVEENILKLVYKHLNPIIHQTVPDVTGSGEGRQEDIEDAIRNYQTSAPDGFIVTPPNHKIQMIGAESQAIRAEGYLDFFKDRVFTGLGVSQLLMGESDGSTAGTADALTTIMHNRVKLYQKTISETFNLFIINELLMEGGWDPWGNPSHRVELAWNEIEIERRIKEQTHALNLWTMNAIPHSELKKALGLTESSWKDFYAHQVQIPQLLASKLGVDPINYSPEEIENLAFPPIPISTGVATKDKSKSGSITKTGGQAGNIVSPSNKSTGPKAKANAPTAHKMMSDLLPIIERLEESPSELLEYIQVNLSAPYSLFLYNFIVNHYKLGGVEFYSKINAIIEESIRKERGREC